MKKVNLDRSINHHIAISSIMMKRVLFKILAKNNLNITPEQWNILYYLSEKGSMTIGEMSKYTYKDFANTSRIAQKLEKLGYIVKMKSEKDKRTASISITDSGRNINKEIHKCAYQAMNICTEGIGVEEQNIILNGLKKFIDNTNNYL